MIFFAVLFALLIEQVRPLDSRNWVHDSFRHWVRWVRRVLNAGQAGHGVMVWAVAVGVPVLFVGLVHLLLMSYSLVLAFVWAVTVLYCTLGFRQFSHHFTEIRTSLEKGQSEQARSALARWQGFPGEFSSSQDLVQSSIDTSVRAVHRHVLGVLVCFTAFWLVGLGPVGAVIFRLADHLNRSCRKVPEESARLATSRVADADCQVATQAWKWINHIPSRATALAFAVVGNFEEAVANWRNEADVPHEDVNDAILLAAAAGALNLGWGTSNKADGTQPVPQLAHLTSLVGLVWRSVVLWMLLLALVVMAHSVA